MNGTGSVDSRWALILAGGDGLRLRSLSRVIAGDERPKQFCRILGRETLLGHTRRRAALAISRDRTLLVLTRAHQRFYRPLVERLPARCVVVQPERRGTAPAILYGALRVATEAPLAAVAVFPSDHYVSDEARFMGHVETAFEAVRARPEVVALLGVAPDSPEGEYGWIEPGDPVPGTRLLRVGRFWEKPGPARARELLQRGGLWNSFVMIARVPALLALIGQAVPELVRAFAAAVPWLGSPAEERRVHTVYDGLPRVSFSDDVLSTCPRNLAVLPVSGVRWSDWGQPERILATLGHLGVQPEWMGRMAPIAS